MRWKCTRRLLLRISDCAREIPSSLTNLIEFFCIPIEEFAKSGKPLPESCKFVKTSWMSSLFDPRGGPGRAPACPGMHSNPMKMRQKAFVENQWLRERSIEYLIGLIEFFCIPIGEFAKSGKPLSESCKFIKELWVPSLFDPLGIVVIDIVVIGNRE